MRLTARTSLLPAAVLLTAAAGIWLIRPHAATGSVHEATLPPLPHQVQVEVVNTTKVPGIARAATEVLRHAGLDVVQFGSGDSTQRDRKENQVLVRRGDTTGAGLAIRTLGHATVINAPDPSRLVDLTILIGAEYLRRQAPTRP